ncbi:MAG: HAD family phosphatase, partial [Gammaproteobacteria bacterium]|nr:HAD family phosphatase [Gammaproteobacteria bacterium]
SGTLDIVEYMRFVLAPLANHPSDVINGWHEQFMSERILSNIPSKSRELLQSHRDAGDFLVLITASNSFNAGPIADELCVDHLIATEPEIIDGHYTGNPVLPACLGEGKVLLLERCLEHSDHTLKGSYFYSDSRNDIPLMERAGFPVAVDPDPHLLDVAQARNWRRISLRD